MPSYVMENPTATFEACLENTWLGRPLFYSDERPYTGNITIGDVGYLRDGQFWRAFNLLHHWDHDINWGGVPRGFEQLSIRDEDLSEERIPPNTILMKGLRETKRDTTTRKFTFTLRHWTLIGLAKGAFILLPDQSVRVKLSDTVTAQWKTLFDTHAKDWCEWTSVTHIVPLKVEELMLITTYVKTPKWLVLSAEGSGQFTLTVQTYRGISAEITDQSGPLDVQFRVGFGPIDPSAPMPDRTKLLPDGGPPVRPSLPNQYLFVEGTSVNDRWKAKAPKRHTSIP